MGDIYFLGATPKDPVGEWFLIHSMDSWIAIHACMQHLTDQEIPFFPWMEAPSAASFAAFIRNVLDDGSFEECAVDYAAQCYDEEWCRAEDREPAEVYANAAEHWINQLQGFLRFLERSGGFMCD